jgi:hypothetical protein
MSKNLIQIWDSLCRKTPFLARRIHWSDGYHAVVEAIDCDKMPYGTAYGYAVAGGQPTNHFEYDKNWRESKVIPCGGNYSWELVDE